MANPGLLPSPRGEGPGGRCPAARGLVPVVGFAGAPVEGASVIQQLSCYGVLADSHLTSPRSTQSSGPPPLPCRSSLGRRRRVVIEESRASGAGVAHPVGRRLGCHGAR